MVISEFQLVDKLTPGEESRPMNLLSANEDDVLLVLTDRVVKVHDFTLDLGAVVPLGEISHDTGLYFSDDVASLKLTSLGSLDCILEISTHNDIIYSSL